VVDITRAENRAVGRLAMRRLVKITLLVAVFVVALGVPAFAQTTGDDYTPQVGGSQVTRTGAATATKGRLPFTGSDNAPSLALIGLCAIAVGGVLVVAARRRSELLQRT
jgi:LPXTG-motif cell wall-anchored protein